MGHDIHAGLHPHITHPRVQPLADGVWTVSAPLAMRGVHIGTRMTIVRLPGGGLWLHSPVEPTPDLVREVAALGEVAHIVAPNKYHNLYVGPMHAAFPDAKVWLAPGLRERIAQLPCDAVLRNEAPTEWDGVLDQLVFDAAPVLGEVVFYHRPTRTLIVTDLCFNMRHAHTPMTRFFLGLTGAWKHFGPSRIIRMITRDKQRARRLVDRILEWDFERVALCHGELVEGDDARARFRDAFAQWLS